MQRRSEQKISFRWFHIVSGVIRALFVQKCSRGNPDFSALSHSLPLSVCFKSLSQYRSRLYKAVQCWYVLCVAVGVVVLSDEGKALITLQIKLIHGARETERWPERERDDNPLIPAVCQGKPHHTHTHMAMSITGCNCCMSIIITLLILLWGIPSELKHNKWSTLFTCST